MPYSGEKFAEAMGWNNTQKTAEAEQNKKDIDISQYMPKREMTVDKRYYSPAYTDEEKTEALAPYKDVAHRTAERFGQSWNNFFKANDNVVVKFGIDGKRQYISQDSNVDYVSKIDEEIGNMAAAPVYGVESYAVEHADDNNSWLSGLGKALRKSAANIETFITPEKQLADAKKMAPVLGISEDVILASKENLAKSYEIYDFINKQKELVPEGQFDMEAVYDEFKGLRDLAEKNPHEAALALKDVKSLRRTKTIVESFTSMLQLGNDEMEWGELSNKLATGDITEAEKKRLEELSEKLMSHQEEMPDFWSAPLEYMAAGVGHSTPTIFAVGKEGVKGYLEGLAMEGLTTAAVSAATGVGLPVSPVAAGVVGSVAGVARGTSRVKKILKIASQLKNLRKTQEALKAAAVAENATRGAKFAGGVINLAEKAPRYMGRYEAFEGMRRPYTGQYFQEYRQLTDENGNRLLTDLEALRAAQVAGTLNAGIEMADIGLIENFLTGRTTKNVIKNVIEEALESGVRQKALKTYAKEHAKDFIKAGLAESAEEAAQSISDDLVHNAIESYTGDTSNKVYSVGEIGSRALENFVETLPVSFAFGAIGASTGVVTGTYHMAKAIKNIGSESKEFFLNQRKTLVGVNMVSQLQQTFQESKLKDTSPETIKDLTRQQLAGTGYEMAYVDVESALEAKNGKEDVEKIAKAAGYTEQEVQTAIEDKGFLSIPVESFAQLATSEEVLDAVTFDKEAIPIAKMKKEVAEINKRIEAKNKEMIANQIELTEGIVHELFPDKEEAELAKEAMYTNLANPSQGWNSVYKEAQAEFNELIAPAMGALAGGMKQGVDIIQNEDGSGVRVSNNAKWYRDFYKEHGRAPSKEELVDMAVAMTTGDAAAPMVEGWIAQSEEEQEHFAAERNAVERAQKKIAALEKIKSRMKSLTGAEMKLTEGLSKEGFAVYRRITNELAKYGGKVARSGRMNAILFARHADIVSEIIREKTGTRYTALDYYNRTIGFGNTSDVVQRFSQPITENINLDDEVDVLDLDKLSTELRNKDSEAALAYVKKLSAEQQPIKTADFKALVGIPQNTDDYGQRHIIFGNSQKKRANRTIRNKSLSNFEKIISHATVIEVEKNKKEKELDGLSGQKLDRQIRKNSVENFYRIMLPVRRNGNIETLIIVAEEFKGEVKAIPQKVSLYETLALAIEKTGTANARTHQGVKTELAVPVNNNITKDNKKSNVKKSKVTYREMLTGVKDGEGNYYINPDGTGNFALRQSVFNQLAGERAKTANRSSLATAKTMAAEGRLPEDIYAETGWLQGKDGKWRFEIPDNMDKIDFSGMKKTHMAYQLGAVYDNEALYEAYPELGRTLVVLDELPQKTNGRVGKRYGLGKVITINQNLSDEEMKETLIHEIQHLIQDREGFAAGGNSRTIINTIAEEIANIDKQLQEDNVSDIIKRRSDIIREMDAAFIAGNEEKAAEYKEKRDLLDKEIKQVLPSDKNLQEVFNLQRRKEYLQKQLDYVDAAASEEEKAKRKYELYFRLGGEQEARITSIIAKRKNEEKKNAYAAKEAKEKALKNYQAQYESSPDEIKHLVDKCRECTRKYVESDYTEEKYLDERQKLEEELRKTVAGEKLLSALEEFEWEEGEEQEAWKDYLSKTYTSPHAYDAIIVFGGNEYGHSEEITSAEIKLKKDSERWTNAIDEWKTQKNKNYSITVMNTPLSLQLVGAEALPIVVDTGKLREIKTSHSEITYNVLKKIPYALTDPVIIANSKTQNGRIVAVVEIETTKGKTVVLPFALNKTKYNGRRAYQANILTTVYGKEDEETWIKNNFTTKDLLYVNSKKATQFLQALGVQFPAAVEKLSSFLNPNIKTEYDLVKLKNENETFYQTAWHGSPYDFNEFDLGAIGSGEGAQAHGWGLYFAKDKAVSDTSYKQRLSTGQVVINGDSYNTIPSLFNLDKKVLKNGRETIADAALYTLVDTLKQEGSYDKAHEKLTKKAKSNLKGILSKSKAALKMLEDNKDNIQIQNGRLYEVEIPDDDVLIDEQKPFYLQPEKVQHEIKDILQNYVIQNFEAVKEEVFYEKELAAEMLSLNQQYQMVVNEYGKNSKAAKNVFKKLLEVEKEYGAENKNNPKRDKWYKENGYKYLTGKEIYKVFVQANNGNSKQASLALNRRGIQGITYEGGTDGRCYVIFDDKAISIIEKYNQAAKNAREDKGRTTAYSDGRRIVELFAGADESTFLHEMGHIFLMDLEQLAKIDDKSAQELETIRKWAKWEKGACKEYQNTPWVREFNERERDILAAEAAGDVLTAEKLKREWMQERFARGFERYLQTGEVPAKGLKAVFRAFKAFLTQIYIKYVSTGGKATKEVEAIMARMIATDDEIEAAYLDSRYKDIVKAGGEKLLNETEKETMQRFQEEAKAEAKEKLLKIVMADLKEDKRKQFEEKVEAERQRKLEELNNLPVFLARDLIKETGGDKNIVLAAGYSTVEEFEEENEITPQKEELLNEYIDNFRAELDKQLIQAELSEDEVDKAINSSVYHRRLVELETQAFARKKRLINKLTPKTETALSNLEEHVNLLPDDVDLVVEKDSAKVKRVMSALSKLKVAAKWNEHELYAIEDILYSNTKEDMNKAIAKFKKAIKEEQLNEEAIAKAAEGRRRMFAEIARDKIKNSRIGEACSVSLYTKREKKAAQRAKILAAAKHYDMAMRAKDEELLNAALAEEARKMQDRVMKIVRDIEKKAKTRSVKLPADYKYWIQHISYLLRITSKDGVQPSGHKSLQDIMAFLSTNQDGGSVDVGYVPTDIFETVLKRENFTGYTSLYIGELEDVANTIKILYTTGKDLFNLKTISGKTIQGAVEEIINGFSLDVEKIKRKYAEKDNGGLGSIGDLNNREFGALFKFLQSEYNALLKPELIIDLLGEAAHKYLYQTYERAQRQEDEMMAAAIDKLADILKPFSRNERNLWKKRQYKVEIKDHVETLSKEQIICMALNMGNEVNFNRLANGTKKDGTTIEDERLRLMQVVADVMTEKDWQLVQDVWDFMNEYWEDTVKVEEQLNGVTLKKQEARPFVAYTKTGKKIKLRGGYYPISYNKEKSNRAADNAQDEVARRQMSGAQVFGTGRGFTNERSEYNNDNPLELQFRVINEHINNVIHNIALRIPARDVYRLITNRDLQEHIIGKFGADAYDQLKQYTLDVWKTVRNNNPSDGLVEQAIRIFRSSTVFSIMGYRVYTALENIANIAPAMQQMGAVNVLLALSNFYSSVSNFRKNMDLTHNSIFMRKRIEHMDRDIRYQKGLFDTPRSKTMEFVSEHAYDFMELTDLMISAPCWCKTYKDELPKRIAEVIKENEENKVRYEKVLAEVEELDAELINKYKLRKALKNEKAQRFYMTPREKQKSLVYGVAYTDDEINIRLAELEEEVKVMQKDLWQKKIELENAAEVKVLTDAEIHEEAKTRAVNAADKVVREIFGSGDTKDLARVQKGGELSKLLTAFYSYFNTQLNAILKTYYQGKYGYGDTLTRWTPFIRAVIYRVILTTLIGTVLRMALLGAGNGEDDKYKKEKLADGTEVKVEVPLFKRFLKEYSKNLFTTSAGHFVYVRDFANYAANEIWDGKSYGRGLSFGIELSAIQKFEAVKNLLAQKARQDEAAAEEAEKYAKMTKKQKKKHDEAKKYKNPHVVTYAEIAKEFGSLFSAATASKTGYTDTINNAVFSTFMYLNDTENQYDGTATNWLRSIVFDKKPARRIPLEKPDKKKKGARK